MQILNIKTATKLQKLNSIYIGRPSKWGNPFIINKSNTRFQVVMKYADWIITQDHLLTDLHELKNKDLLCFCSPKLCHGHVLRILVEDFISPV